MNLGVNMIRSGARRVPVSRLPVRNMTTLADMKSRINSIDGIEKLTNSMRMMATAKLRRAQLLMEQARQFTGDINGLKIDPEPKEMEKGDKLSLVVITADRGLCGGFNSSVTKKAKKILAANVDENGSEASLFLFGRKAKSPLEKGYGSSFRASYTMLQKAKVRSFDQNAELADSLVNIDSDRGLLLFNWFKNVMSFETRLENIYTFDQFKGGNVEKEFEMIGDIRSFYEFRMATHMHWYLAEQECTEVCARMNAMGGSTKAASEMKEKLQRTYNNVRQAKVTAELMEIISGSEATK